MKKKLFELRADPQSSVTFRIPLSTKRKMEKKAEERGISSTRFLIEAIEFAADDEPPQYFVNYFAGYKPRRLPWAPHVSTKKQIAKDYVLKSRGGVTAREVAAATKQPPASAWRTLMLLAEEGEIASHGVRKSERLFAANDDVIVLRTRNARDAVKKVLRERGAVDHITLRAEATMLYTAVTGRVPDASTILVAMRRAVRRGEIVKVSTGSRGPVYRLVRDRVPAKGGVSPMN